MYGVIYYLISCILLPAQYPGYDSLWLLLHLILNETDGWIEWCYHSFCIFFCFALPCTLSFPSSDSQDVSLLPWNLRAEQSYFWFVLAYLVYYHSLHDWCGIFRTSLCDSDGAGQRNFQAQLKKETSGLSEPLLTYSSFDFSFAMQNKFWYFCMGGGGKKPNTWSTQMGPCSGSKGDQFLPMCN